jgi:hypothetical protein
LAHRQAARWTDAVRPLQRRVLTVASVVEVATGVGLVILPSVVVTLLLGSRPSPEAMPIARVLGLSLLGLGIACWSTAQQPARLAAMRGMLVYNAGIALYLGSIAIRHDVHGLLLWPAAVFHAVVAVALLLGGREAKTTPPV